VSLLSTITASLTDEELGLIDDEPSARLALAVFC